MSAILSQWTDEKILNCARNIQDINDNPQLIRFAMLSNIYRQNFVIIKGGIDDFVNSFNQFSIAIKTEIIKRKIS